MVVFGGEYEKEYEPEEREGTAYDDGRHDAGDEEYRDDDYEDDDEGQYHNYHEDYIDESDKGMKDERRISHLSTTRSVNRDDGNSQAAAQSQVQQSPSRNVTRGTTTSSSASPTRQRRSSRMSASSATTTTTNITTITTATTTTTALNKTTKPSMKTPVTTATTASSKRWIALFGANSPTGRQFLRLALDAGYGVRVLRSNNNSNSGGGTGKQTSKNGVVLSSSSSSSSHGRSEEFFMDHPDLQCIVGDFEDTDTVRAVLSGVRYVVCMLHNSNSHNSTNGSSSSSHYHGSNSTNSKKKKKKKKKKKGGMMDDATLLGRMTATVRLLYPLMKQEPSIQVFLYQATCLASDCNGNTPVLAKLLKWMSPQRSNLIYRDMDTVIQYIARQHLHQQHPGENATNRTQQKLKGTSKLDDDLDDEEHLSPRKDRIQRTAPPHFAYVVTRPPIFLKDGPSSSSSQKLAASKSQPGPLSVLHVVDLAEFSLNALLTEKLHNTCPYIIREGLQN